MNNLVSFSGGKDSTAMLLMMLERGEPVHAVVFFDTGWEFPQIFDHLERVERETGIEIVRLKPERSFNYWMYERPIIARKGPMKGQVHRIGNGWPSWIRRWCTGIKIDALDKYRKSIGDSQQCIGFAADEKHRTETKSQKKAIARYPLIEYGVTEAEALEYCYGHGYTWGGLYNYFTRVSCFCCPLQGLAELRAIRKNYPPLWKEILRMDASIPKHNRGFQGYKTAHDIERRFAAEDKQGLLFLESNREDG